MKFKVRNLSTLRIPAIDPVNEILSLTIKENETLEGIENWRALTYIEIKSAFIKDFGPLSALPNLKTLDLSENHNITGLPGLGRLDQLTFLNLMNTPNFTDLTAFQDPANLKNLLKICIKNSGRKKWDYPGHLWDIIDYVSYWG